MHCQIRVRGQLSQTWQARFAPLQIAHEVAGTTLLSGSLPDQAALHGVLLQIINLGLPLLSLETSTDPPQESAGSAGDTGSIGTSGPAVPQ